MPVDGGLPRGFLNLLVPAIDRMDLVVPKYHANGKCLWRRTDRVFERPAGPNHHSNVMGKFRNGVLTTALIEIGEHFRDFALHYGLPPSDLLSLRWIVAKTRWSIDLEIIEILVDHYDACRFNGWKISCIQSAATPSKCVESSTARPPASRSSAVNRPNGE